MADGLLGGLLGYGNRLRSNLRGLLGDPVTYANEALGNALPSMEELAAQARQMGQTGQVPANVDPRIMDLGMGLLGAIKVYHGSPHTFAKASSEHIGTGEGAQAYGHGLYWAETPEVAMDYQKALSPRAAAQSETYKKTTDRLYEYAEKVAPESDSVSDLVSLIKQKGSAAAGVTNEQAKRLLDLDARRLRAFNAKKEGNLYEANLRWPDAAREAADPLGPQHFLDWDKPLSQQPEAIKQSLKGLSNVSDEQVKTLVLEAMGGKTGIRGNPATAGDLYRALANYQGWNSGDRISAFTGEYVGSAQGAVSKHLKDKGIPGITYLDAGSRAAGQGTRNYVTFDDALVELLKRNGISLAGQ